MIQRTEAPNEVRYGTAGNNAIWINFTPEVLHSREIVIRRRVSTIGWRNDVVTAELRINGRVGIRL